MGPCARSRNTRQWSPALLPPAPRGGRRPRRRRTAGCSPATSPAAVALPGFDNSAMDGYAARWAEVGGAAQAPVRLPVADDIPAGRTDVVPLAPGHRAADHDRRPAARRRRRRRPGRAAPTAAPTSSRSATSCRPARHLRAAGEDIAAGDGGADRRRRRSAPPSSGLAAAVGVTTLPVRRRPRVLVLSTGSELVAPGQPLLPGQIYESNSALLVAAVEEAGGEARRLHFVPDDVDQFLATVRAELAGADLLITSGGVSAGAYEVVKDAFRGLGTVEFAKVAMQPGGPQGAGTVDGVPVVTLPGNPVSVVRLLRGVRPARAAPRARPRLPRPAARARPADRRRCAPPPGGASSCAAATTAATVSQVGGPGSHLVAAPGRGPTAWSSSPRTSPNCPPAPRSTSC